MSNKPTPSPQPRTALQRYQRAEFLISGLLILLALAFGFALTQRSSTDDDTAASAPYAAAQVLLGSSHLTPDENRQTFLLRDGFERINNVAELAVTVRPAAGAGIDADANAAPVWSGLATPYPDGDGTYWVAYPHFPAAGDYDFVVRATLDDAHATTFERTVSATVYAEPIGVAVGETAPPAPSFTLNMQDRPERITTDLTPNDAFYQMSVAAAVSSGRPSVIVFGTPELCTRKLWNLCGATLDVFDAMVVEYENRVNFVHVEIYNLDTGKYVEAWNTYGLAVSPWIYVVDAAGTVNYRYDAIVGAEELRPRLESLLATGG